MKIEKIGNSEMFCLGLLFISEANLNNVCYLKLLAFYVCNSVWSFSNILPSIYQTDLGCHFTQDTMTEHVALLVELSQLAFPNALLTLARPTRGLEKTPKSFFYFSHRSQLRVMLIFQEFQKDHMTLLFQKHTFRHVHYLTTQTDPK